MLPRRPPKNRPPIDQEEEVEFGDFELYDHKHNGDEKTGPGLSNRAKTKIGRDAFFGGEDDGKSSSHLTLPSIGDDEEEEEKKYVLDSKLAPADAVKSLIDARINDLKKREGVDLTKLYPDEKGNDALSARAIREKIYVNAVNLVQANGIPSAAMIADPDVNAFLDDMEIVFRGRKEAFDRLDNVRSVKRKISVANTKTKNFTSGEIKENLRVDPHENQGFWGGDHHKEHAEDVSLRGKEYIFTGSSPIPPYFQHVVESANQDGEKRLEDNDKQLTHFLDNGNLQNFTPAVSKSRSRWDSVPSAAVSKFTDFARWIGRGLLPGSKQKIQDNEHFQMLKKRQMDIMSSMIHRLHAGGNVKTNAHNYLSQIKALYEEADPSLLDPIEVASLKSMIDSLEKEIDEEKKNHDARVNALNAEFEKQDASMQGDLKKIMDLTDDAFKYRILMLLLAATPLGFAQIFNYMGPLKDILQPFLSDGSMGDAFAATATNPVLNSIPFLPFGKVADVLGLDDFMKWFFDDCLIIGDVFGLVGDLKNSAIAQGVGGTIGFGTLTGPLTQAVVGAVGCAYLLQEREIDIYNKTQDFLTKQKAAQDKIADNYLKKEGEDLKDSAGKHAENEFNILQKSSKDLMLARMLFNIYGRDPNLVSQFDHIKFPQTGGATATISDMFGQNKFSEFTDLCTFLQDNEAEKNKIYEVVYLLKSQNDDVVKYKHIPDSAKPELKEKMKEYFDGVAVVELGKHMHGVKLSAADQKAIDGPIADFTDTAKLKDAQKVLDRLSTTIKFDIVEAKKRVMTSRLESSTPSAEDKTNPIRHRKVRPNPKVAPASPPSTSPSNTTASNLANLLNIPFINL